MADLKTFDYIVVGAGAAGSVVAHRLVKADKRVLLLEAGSNDNDERIYKTDIPSMTSMWGEDPVNWGYSTVPQDHLADRVIPIAQGRVLGGSTAINAMMYVRGSRHDFDYWHTLGNDGWGYEDVLPFFKKSETFEGGTSTYRGGDGLLDVIHYQNPAPSSSAFVAAAAELGYGDDEPHWDYNGAGHANHGFLYQSTRVSPERRATTASAFLHPLQDNPNLTTEVNALASKVLIEDGAAVGVEYLQAGKTKRAYADAEVIIAAGSFASPKLLMLSGIGPATHLREHGITPIVDLAGVGQNLQDHMLFGVGYESKQDLPFPQLLSEAGLFVHTNAQDKQQVSADLQFFFGPVQYFDDKYKIEGSAFTFAPILAQPQSVGQVTLKTGDPRDLAVVNPHYLESERDVEVLVKGVELARALAATSALADFSGRELAPGKDVTSFDALADYVRQSASTVWHPVGTCKMGHDAAAVVNSQLQVHGVANLRVADASVMPKITSGNTNAATIMIGEKAASLLQSV